jgi:DNA-binding SARP family transcriptional activator
MNSSPLHEQQASAGISNILGASSLVFFLKRGLEYVQRGYYTEGVAFLALTREQLSPDQIDLADVLDTFIHRHASYQRAQQALQEVTTHFAEVCAELQAQAASFATALPALIQSVDTPQPYPYPLPEEKNRHAQQLLCLPSQYFQEPPSPTPRPVKKDSSPLLELSITCFGRFEVRRLGKPVVLCSSCNGQRILRYLVASPGHYATSDTLQTMLWPEDESEVTQRKLYIAISALRHSLDDGFASESRCSYILCKNRVYSLNPAVTIRTDMDEFLRCYQAGQQASEERSAFYEKACRLYTGPFLAEDMYADWSFIQREQLNQLYLAMCRILADHYFKVKRYEDAMKWAIAILKENRCDESAHRQLIQVYAAQGYRSEAIHQYQRCECLLREELGVQPMPETQTIFQAILVSEPTSPQ